MDFSPNNYFRNGFLAEQLTISRRSSVENHDHAFSGQGGKGCEKACDSYFAIADNSEQPQSNCLEMNI